jgi:hypothetical protein
VGPLGNWNVQCANADCTLLGGSGTFSPFTFTSVVLFYKQGRGWSAVLYLRARLGVDLGGVTLMSIAGSSHDDRRSGVGLALYLLRNLPLNGFQERLDGCGVGLSIYHNGRPVLGQTFGIPATRNGPGLMVGGSPTAILFPGCPACSSAPPTSCSRRIAGRSRCHPCPC